VKSKRERNGLIYEKSISQSNILSISHFSHVIMYVYWIRYIHYTMKAPFQFAYMNANALGYKSAD